VSRFVLAATVVALAAGTAAADPVIDQVATKSAKNGVLTVTVESTFSAKGELWLSGDVNGTPVVLKKRLRASHKTLKFVVNPARLRLGHKLTAGLHFSFDVLATETASGSQTTQSVAADVPVPCVLIPGFADEQTPGAFDTVATALDLLAGGRYAAGAAKSFFVVHEYASLTKSLATLGAEVDKSVKSALRGTPFVKVDIVGYSYGGVVARQYMALKGGSRVRNCVLLGAPNEGTPIAYIGVGLLKNNLLSGLLGQNAALAAAVGGLVNDQTKGALRNLYPTYQWLDGNALTVGLALTILGDTSTPLTALNQIAPPFGVRFDAFYYSSTPGGQLGTVDHIDVANLSGGLTGGSQLDPATLATGDGDGVVPAHSVTMDETSAWHLVITGHDVGAGTHVTMPADPNVLAGVVAIIAQ
jgi:pimeloyl-ACP methyl ester carboxylesterase